MPVAPSSPIPLGLSYVIRIPPLFVSKPEDVLGSCMVQSHHQQTEGALVVPAGWLQGASDHFKQEGRLLMTRYTSQRIVISTALFVLVAAMVLPLQPVFGEGGARRDVIRSEDQHRQDAITLAKEAADHSKQGHVGPFLTSAEAALQHALKSGKDAHVDAGIAELKHAIEHGNVGHADVATKHAEQAVMHLSEK